MPTHSMLGYSPMQSAVSYFRSRFLCGRERGFTLIEGLVVIAIITLLAAQIVANQHTYGSYTRLSLVLDDIALSIRQAQVYATAVRPEGGNFRRLYGLYFPTDSNVFYLYTEPIGTTAPSQTGCPAVDGGDCGYDDGEVLAGSGVYALPPNYSIVGAKPSAGAINCGSINLIYTRPFTESRFFDGSGNQYDAAFVDITVQGPSGEKGVVRVLMSGYAYGSLTLAPC